MRFKTKHPIIFFATTGILLGGLGCADENMSTETIEPETTPISQSAPEEVKLEIMVKDQRQNPIDNVNAAESSQPMSTMPSTSGGAWGGQTSPSTTANGMGQSGFAQGQSSYGSQSSYGRNQGFTGTGAASTPAQPGASTFGQPGAAGAPAFGGGAGAPGFGGAPGPGVIGDVGIGGGPGFGGPGIGGPGFGGPGFGGPGIGGPGFGGPGFGGPGFGGPGFGFDGAFGPGFGGPGFGPGFDGIGPGFVGPWGPTPFIAPGFIGPYFPFLVHDIVRSDDDHHRGRRKHKRCRDDDDNCTKPTTSRANLRRNNLR